MSHFSFRIDFSYIDMLFRRTGRPTRRWQHYRKLYKEFLSFWIGMKNGFGLERLLKLKFIVRGMV